ncbi:hypothetical protein [Ottowia sp. SB7-C50]|uniref:hypothetical protein n=1 Tax=Ottowia sp. SB7-C50 TaxID=3081231 RepID=UPI002952D017|nr:hypothetical protein [Ottowia sp. SB7-C50]WOP15784.1 hypothetical protein R0D99_01520 [Ottowia sp. SB7-C50]
MPLRYLIFDASDDGAGTGTWEAMASVRAPDLPAVRTEVQRVIDWAEAHAPGPRAPLDEGGAWDADVHTAQDGDWIALTFTLTGPWEWGEAMRAALTPEDAI